MVALQQRLPLAVLKLSEDADMYDGKVHVATALTACGIETILRIGVDPVFVQELQQRLPLAVLKRFS